MLLAACATVEVPRPAGALRITLRAVIAAPERYAASLVQWGGAIVTSRNLADGTQVEVLAYPLDGHGRPDTDAAPSGRFLAFSRRFLDPLEYASGRLVTVSGRIRDIVSSRVGEARVRYPRIDAEGVFLWPKSSSYSAVRPTIHLGVGTGGFFGGIGVGF